MSMQMLWDFFYALGLDYCIITIELHFQSPKVLASCFCVVIKLDLFSIKF